MTNASLSALIIGFIGRRNSGDELMLAMHLEALRGMGIHQIDLWTEFPEHARLGGYELYWKPRKHYDLVIIGGGGLDVGFGFYPAALAKVRYNATVVFSSVNLPSEDPRYVAMLNAFCDCIITRSERDWQRMKPVLPQLHFLPDIGTAYRHQVRPDLPKVGLVLRVDAAPLLNFAPADPFDVLALSQCDAGASRAYAARHGAPLIELWQADATEHVQRVAAYQRVVSVGRFHAALYAARLGPNLAYLFPTLYKELPDDIRHASGRLNWPAIQRIAQAHEADTKAGVPSTALAAYGPACLADYAAIFQTALDRRR